MFSDFEVPEEVGGLWALGVQGVGVILRLYYRVMLGL